MKNKVETLKIGERVFVTPIGDVEVKVTTFSPLNAFSDDKDLLQVDVYHGGVLKTFGYLYLNELNTIVTLFDNWDCNVDMEILLQTIDLTTNGSEDECEDHLDKHYQSDLYGMETYNGWHFDDTTACETLYWVIGKEIAFTMYLNNIV